MRTCVDEKQLSAPARRSHSRVETRNGVEQLEPRTFLSSVSTLASFSTSGPFDPSGSIVRDSSGTIYAIVNGIGSQSNASGIVKLAKGSSTPTLVASFPPSGSLSADPVGLIIDGSNNIYGVTENGGDANQDGTLFELPSGATSITTLAQFDQLTTGHSPTGNIVMDGQGNIYGVCGSGGTLGGGSVWKFVRNNSTLTQVAAFSPIGGLETVRGVNSIAIDTVGDLFGTTSGYPLAGDYGSVWEIPVTGGMQTLAAFSNTNGSVPTGPVVVDSSGNIFGETQYGGANSNGSTPTGLGTVYELVNGSGTITSLASFDGTNGQYPVGGLVADSSGNLFGVASKGGTVTSQISEGGGNVFEVAANSAAITPQASFTQATGYLPKGGLLIDGGTVYGTTSAGGSGSGGTIFQLGGGGNAGSSALSATMTAKSPAAAISGQKFQGLINSTLKNTTSSTVSSSMTFNVYLTADGLVDNNSILLGTSGSKKLTIKAHKTAVAHARIKSIPLTTPAGVYHYIVEYKDSTGATTDALSSNTITISTPQIDLSPTFAKFRSSAKAGRPVVETISVANSNANVAATGTLSIVVAFENDLNPAAGGPPVVIKKKVNIRPGRPLRIPLSLKAPSTAGSYLVLVSLDSSGITSATDTNSANDSITSTSPLVVS